MSNNSAWQLTISEIIGEGYKALYAGGVIEQVIARNPAALAALEAIHTTLERLQTLVEYGDVAFDDIMEFCGILLWQLAELRSICRKTENGPDVQSP